MAKKENRNRQPRPLQNPDNIIVGILFIATLATMCIISFSNVTHKDILLPGLLLTLSALANFYVFIVRK